MNTQNNLAGILAVASIVLSVIGLIVSPVGASAPMTPTNGDTGAYGSAPGYHHAFNATQMTARLQASLTKLGQQGVDISQPQADISNGNTTAAMQWLMAYNKANPGAFGNQTRQHPVNATQQTDRLQSVVTKLGQQGVDVTQALTDLSTGNVKGAMQWLMGYNNVHPGTIGIKTPQRVMNSTQMTARLQASLTKLGQQGVDVSQPQADISSGNVTAAMQWLTDYHKAHPGVMNTTAQHFGNTSAWHKGASFRSHHQLSGNQTSVRPSWVPEQTQSA
jgi:hypothetical protein